MDVLETVMPNLCVVDGGAWEGRGNKTKTKQKPLEINITSGERNNKS